MTITVESPLAEVTRPQVEDLLYLEAELLDDWELDTWLTLYTDDAHYEIPCPDDPGGTGQTSLMLIHDNRMRMASRVERLNSRKAHREYPHSNLRHLVTNVRLAGVVDGELLVRASFLVNRCRAGRETTYTGRFDYRLVLSDGALRIRHKRVTLDMTVLRPASDVAVIL
jgi:p-cumate 2,3-dioxygenase beta subunit